MLQTIKSCFDLMSEKLRSTNKTDYKKIKDLVSESVALTDFCDLLDPAANIEPSLRADHIKIDRSKLSESKKNEKFGFIDELRNTCNTSELCQGI